MGSTYPSKHPKESDKGKRPQGSVLKPDGKKPGHVAPKSEASPTQHNLKQTKDGWVER